MTLSPYDRAVMRARFEMGGARNYGDHGWAEYIELVAEYEADERERDMTDAVL